MSEEKPKNIGELIDHLKQFDPKTKFVRLDNLLSFKLCSWSPIPQKLVPDEKYKGNFTFLYTGHNPQQIVNMMIVG